VWRAAIDLSDKYRGDDDAESLGVTTVFDGERDAREDREG